MKKQWLLILIPVVTLAACLKNNKIECTPKQLTTTAPATEVSALKGILAGSGVTVTEDPRGFFYNMTVTGTGAKPTTCSTIQFDYVAKLMNGTTVDSANNAVYVVNQFIVGWQEAIPLMNAGSSMTLYLPPSLAYGSAVVGSIPANSNLRFDIKLKQVQ